MRIQWTPNGTRMKLKWEPKGNLVTSNDNQTRIQWTKWESNEHPMGIRCENPMGIRRTSNETADENPRNSLTPNILSQVVCWYGPDESIETDEYMTQMVYISNSDEYIAPDEYSVPDEHITLGGSHIWRIWVYWSGWCPNLVQMICEVGVFGFCCCTCHKLPQNCRSSRIRGTAHSTRH